jgi:hypothetical protein
MIRELLARFAGLFRQAETSTVSVVDFETFARLKKAANQRKEQATLQSPKSEIDQEAQRECSLKGEAPSAVADPLQQAAADLLKAKEELGDEFQRTLAGREHEFSRAIADLGARFAVPGNDDGRYAIWQRFDDDIREVMRRHHRRVGSHGRLDFYHGEDWFHELYDGFAVRTARALTFPLLRDLQAVAARHHPAALVSFGGEMDTPMLGLRVLVTATSISAAWEGLSATDCRIKLSQTKVRIL